MYGEDKQAVTCSVHNVYIQNNLWHLIFITILTGAPFGGLPHSEAQYKPYEVAVIPFPWNLVFP